MNRGNKAECPENEKWQKFKKEFWGEKKVRTYFEICYYDADFFSFKVRTLYMLLFIYKSTHWRLLMRKFMSIKIVR